MKQERIRTGAGARAIRAVLGAALFPLAGCMVGPNYVPPHPVLPDAYGEAQGTAQPEETARQEIRWWCELGDARLSDLVDRAIVANHGVAIAQARRREARAARQIAQSLLSPQLGIGASVLWFRGSDAALQLPGASLEDTLFQTGMEASWVVDLFGGTRRGVESARANEQAVASDRRGVVLVVAAETARAYVELRGVQEQLQIEAAILEQQRKTLSVTEERLGNGLASELEVLRARTEVEATSAEIPALEQAERQYIHLLSTLLGEEPTALATELEPPARIPAVPDRIALGIPSDLLRRRPDVQRAERQLAAATAMVGVETAKLFPRVVLGGSAGFQSRDAGDLLDGGSDPSSTYYLAGPVIDWNLFDGGRRKAGIRLAEAQVDAAKASYQDTVLRAFREVESSIVAVDRGRARVRDLERLSATARQSAEIARRDYERGILDQLTVLDAQRQSNRADLLLSQGEVALAAYVVGLYEALGGGWEVAEPSSADNTVDPSRQGEASEDQ